MTKGVKVATVLVITIVIMVALGVLAMRVGGVSIRSASQSYAMGQLEVANSALLPGVPVTVGIILESFKEIKTSPKLLLRLSSGTIVIDEITQSELTGGEAKVVLPCSSGMGKNGPARLVLIDGNTKNILAQSGSLTILEPGPDCI